MDAGARAHAKRQAAHPRPPPARWRNAPSSVVGKFPAADPDSRRSGSAHTLYVREVAFYRELAATVDIYTPRPILGETDPPTGDFTLILEDLAPAGPGDQLAGCSIADSLTAMREAAALHAPRWNDPTLDAVQCFVVAASRRRDLRAVLPGIIAKLGFRLVGRIIVTLKPAAGPAGPVVPWPSPLRGLFEGTAGLDQAME